MDQDLVILKHEQLETEGIEQGIQSLNENNAE